MAIGWGIVSTGRHPDQKIAPAITASGSRLVAVCSRDRTRASEFAEKHGIANAYDSLEEMLQDRSVDAVFIASPNSLHAPHTIAAATAGKHVLVEKPMATDLKSALDMVSVARANHVLLGVGFHLRFHPGHRTAKSIVESGDLGRLSMVQGQWGLWQPRPAASGAAPDSTSWWQDPAMIGGASILMGTGVHVIDLLQFLTGREIVEVATLTDGQRERRPLEGAAAVALRLSDGTIGTICVGRRLNRTENDVMIYGSEGRIGLRGTVWEALTGALDVIAPGHMLNEDYGEDPLALYRLELDAFEGAIERGEEFHPSGEDGLSVVQVTSAVVESARTGRSVTVDRRAGG